MWNVLTTNISLNINASMRLNAQLFFEVQKELKET
jgi:hypothetical protein